MALWAKIMRVAALALLMIAATDILFVDTAFAASCNSNSTSSSGSQNSQQSPGPGDDDCYCCCTHIIPGFSQIPLVTINRIEVVSAELMPPLASVEPRPILHPPRS